MSGGAAGAAEPHRIVSLSPAVTEILFAIGAGPQVVARTSQCDYPVAAQRLPKVGDFLTPNLESIVAQHPDLLIGVGYEDSAKRVALQRLPIRGLFLESPHGVEDVYRLILAIGSQTQCTGKAQTLVDDLRAHLRPVVTSRPQRVVVLVWASPLIAAGPTTYLGDLVRLAGGRIVIDSKIGYPKISPEILVASRPEVILVTDLAMVKVVRRLPGMAQSRVPIRVLPADMVLRPGPRLAAGFAAVKQSLAVSAPGVSH